MSTLRTITRRSALAVGASVLAIATVAAPTVAFAEPASTSGTRTYQISGSDTIQDVLNGITTGYSTFGSFQSNLDSWNAFSSNSPDTITPKSGGATLGRPHGSGDGVKALSASWSTTNAVFAQTVSGVTTNYTLQQGGTHELDFARSSSKPGTAVVAGSANDKLTFVPFARDAVTPVIQDPAGGVNYSAVNGLTIDQLKAIFGTGSSADGVISSTTTGGVTTVYYNTGGTALALKPVLPQASSGTRSFFLSAIGVTTPGAWVSQGVNENDASALNTEGQIAPFSAAQWIAQKNGFGGNTFTGTNSSTLRLASFNNGSTSDFAATASGSTWSPNTAVYGSNSAVPTSTSYPLARDTYIVVPTANYTGSVKTLVDNLGQKTHGVSPAVYVVQDYGFLRLNYGTGGTGQLHSNWTN